LFWEWAWHHNVVEFSFLQTPTTGKP
jgi:hypothetical protein